MIDLNKLNNKQREAVTTTEGPVLVVAGAGSGKTLVLTYRIAYLIQNGTHPSKILALTFTNKAASEMKERIKLIAGSSANYLFMGTFHSIFARFLRAEAELIGYTRDYTIYDTEDSLSVIRSILKDFNLSENSLQPGYIQNVISKAKNSLYVFLKDIESYFFNHHRKLYDIYVEYSNRLKKSNAMDFDDLLIKPIELFNKEKDVLERYRKKFDYILVDEYQDTNLAQYHLLRMLVNEKRNICVVGDDAQSIYKWRGAEVRNIIDFPKDFSEVRIIRLEQNYRSTKSILSVADSVIKNNVNQIQKNLWTSNEQGEKVTITVCFDERDEANFVASKIQRLIETGKYEPKDIVILYRTNAQSRVFEDVFMKSSIPYTIIGGIEFYRRKEIKDVLAYLKLIVNPNDDESFLRIINFPRRGIGDISLEKLKSVSMISGKSLFENIPVLINKKDVNDRTKSNFKIFYDFILKYRDLMNKTDVLYFVRSLVDESGILKLYQEEKTEESLERYENVLQLIAAIEDYHQQNPEKTLIDYLQEISLISDVDNWEDRQNSVVLMTLHSAKGLEFKVVFLVGIEDGLLPLFRDNTMEDEEEERRLFYVGCTRAKKLLFITYARNRYRYNNVYPQIQSRFIDEIEEELIITEATPKAAIYLKNNKYFIDDVVDYSFKTEKQFLQEDSKSIRVGAIVEHDVFGRGKVQFVDGSGDNQKVIVTFNNGVKKYLMVKFANLKIIKG